MIWADWQSCSDTFEELLDPVRAQYVETFVVVRCQYRGETYSRCVYIWVDKDDAMVRGHHQGYPKKLGELYLTRPVNVGVAGPRLEPGGRFGATCSAYGRRLIDATFTITGTAPRRASSTATRWSTTACSRRSRATAPTPCTRSSRCAATTSRSARAARATATIELHESPVEELTRLAPVEMIGGYWQEVGTNWRGGTTLARTAT